MRRFDRERESQEGVLGGARVEHRDRFQRQRDERARVRERRARADEFDRWSQVATMRASHCESGGRRALLAVDAHQSVIAACGGNYANTDGRY